MIWYVATVKSLDRTIVGAVDQRNLDMGNLTKPVAAASPSAKPRAAEQTPIRSPL